MIDSVSIVIQGPLRDPKIKFAIQDYLKTGYEVIVSCSSSCDITMLGDAKDQVTLVRTINPKLSGYADEQMPIPIKYESCNLTLLHFRAKFLQSLTTLL